MWCIVNDMNESNPIIFDHKRVARHKARAAKSFAGYDFLLREAEERLSERRQEFARTFENVLDISGHPDRWDAHFRRHNESLDCNENSFDLVVSAGGLHWVNDLPGALVQIRKSLKPKGLFLAIMPGGETLKELRMSFERAEIALSGGVSPRVSPFVDVRDAAGLLQRAGFSMPVADSDVLTVEYEHPLKLMHDLRGMGESNAIIESKKHFTSRTLLAKACEYYMEHFRAESGRISASFELVTLTGIKA